MPTMTMNKQVKTKRTDWSKDPTYVNRAKVRRLLKSMGFKGKKLPLPVFMSLCREINDLVKGKVQEFAKTENAKTTIVEAN